MDKSFVIGLGVTFVFGLLPFAFKDLSPVVTWGGLALGVIVILWPFIPLHPRFDRPLLLIAFALICLAGATGWIISLAGGDALTPVQSQVGLGGKGGSGTITNGNGLIFGGRGGRGSTAGGRGGDGGSGSIAGGTGVIIGGEGGDAGYIDSEGIAHGGAGGRSPLARLKELGLSSPGSEVYDLISTLRQEYIRSHNNLSAGMLSGTEPLPDDWVNKRFREMGVPWHYEGTPNGYKLASIAEPLK